MIEEKKRVFFGFEIEALWQLPEEKELISEKNRHITLLFLGENIRSEVQKYFFEMPRISCEIGLVGYFSKCLFLPKKHPRLVAFEVDFFDKNEIIKKFQKDLFEFFKNKNFKIRQKNDFLPHVTLLRNNFDKKKWLENFKFAPLYIKSFNFYESFPKSEYQTLWKKDFLKPFEEIEHTADIAFIIRGKNYLDLLYSAFTALSFKTLYFMNYIEKLITIDSIDDVIICLNNIIMQAEIDGIHMPFKAVSFNTKIKQKDEILHWEMIVDV